MNFIRKIFLGNSVCQDCLKESPLLRRKKNLKIIWNSEDYGIQRIVRLFLASSQFIFIGTYVRQLFGRKSSINRDISIDVLVILKILWVISMVYYDISNITCLIISIWFSLETFLYIPTLIFASDYLSRPRSYKRSLLLFFLNYIEITLFYGYMYKYFSEGFNNKFLFWYDSLYFSFITSSTTGYGDYSPVSGVCKFLVSSQTVVSLVFIALFLNIFSSKLEIKGYFNDNSGT